LVIWCESFYLIVKHAAKTGESFLDWWRMFLRNSGHSIQGHVA